MEVYVSVKNFGKIREARVNISNFTIFVGNNNSGKTYLMELIYMIINRLSAVSPDIALPPMGNIDAFYVGNKEIGLLNEWVNHYLEGHIKEIILETFNAAIPIEEVTLEFTSVDDCNYEVYLLTERTIEFLMSKDLISHEELSKLLMNKSSYSGAIVSRKGEEENVILNAQFSKSISMKFAKKIQTGLILAQILGGEARIQPNILFLPASRMGLMLLYKHYFGNSSKDKDALVRDKNQNPKGITKPVQDFLSFLLNYNYTEWNAQKNEEVIKFIYDHLIDGTISEKTDATVYIPRDEENREIPIFIASSMVNEVVPVIKALTDSDDFSFLFYDEVETSMHPLKQIEMAKLLNHLNNRGIRLIVSTHSDTMATEINNLLLLSRGNTDFETAKAILESNGILIEQEDLLLSENIHLYQFTNEPDGKSSVQELEFKEVPGTGYDFSLFNSSTRKLFEGAKVAMGLHNEN
ncbi:MAG: ATP-binding protein [Lachnospiraceae bacterium]|nr:ATP-binding protein [Lachnospiraceae bacterium]